MHKGIGHHLLINTWEVGHRLRFSEGVDWQWGENGVYSIVPAQASLGEMFCWDGI